VENRKRIPLFAEIFPRICARPNSFEMVHPRREMCREEPNLSFETYSKGNVSFIFGYPLTNEVVRKWQPIPEIPLGPLLKKRSFEKIPLTPASPARGEGKHIEGGRRVGVV
jgi:hypothetical protein